MTNERLKSAPKETTTELNSQVILPEFEDGIEALREKHKCHKVIVGSQDKPFTKGEPIKIWVDEKADDNIIRIHFKKEDFDLNGIAHAVSFIRETKWKEDGSILACDGTTEANGKKLPKTRLILAYDVMYLLNPNPNTPRLQ
jgi:hypothetical protein